MLTRPEQWLRRPKPDLQIVPDELWAAAQARKQAISEHPAAWAKKPKRLLCGLLKCTGCGSGMSLNGVATSAPATRSGGVCTNGEISAALRIDERVLAGVREHLLAPKPLRSRARDAGGR